MVRPPLSEPSISRCASPSSSDSRYPTSLDESASRRSLNTLAGMPRSPPNACRPNTAASRHNSAKVESSFDYFGVDAVRAAIQAFDKAADTMDVSGEAYSMCKRFGSSRECKLLIDAGERLVHEVGVAIHGDLKVIRRLPKAIAHKTLELCCSGFLPDLNELRHLRQRVQSLQREQMASSRTYLDEIVYWRTQARKGEEISFQASDHYFWDAMSSLPSEFQNLATEIIIEKLKCYVSQDHAKALADIQGHLEKFKAQIASLRQEVERLRHEVDDANEARSGLASRLQLQVCKLNEMEKQHLVTQEAAQRCAQVEDALRIEHRKNIELSADVKELRGLLSASYTAKLERELSETRRENAALEMRALAVENVAHDKDIGSFKLRDLVEVNSQEILQRYLPSLGEHLSAVTGEKRFEDWLYRIAIKLQTEIQSWKDSYDSERLAKVDIERRLDDALQELDDYHCAFDNPDEDAGLGIPVSEAVAKGQSHELLGSVTYALDENTTASPASPASPISGSSILSTGQMSSPLSPRRQSRLSLLKQRHEIDVQELAAVSERLREKEQEVQHCRLFAVKAHSLENELKTLKDDLSKTKAELCEARDSHLHPAQVAQLKSELQRAKHECVAGANINKALQSSVQYMQSKLVQDLTLPHGDPILEDASFIVEVSNRNVHSRLYEDALRRRYQCSNILNHLRLSPFGAEREDITGEASDDVMKFNSLRQRSFSAPSRVLLSGDIAHMYKMNALHLVSMRAEPIFSRPIKLPENKDKKTPALRPVALEPAALDPQPPNKHKQLESSYEEQERVGSLVVWRRASIPGSQSSTTAPSSPSLPPNSRPDSARTSSRPGPVVKVHPRPRSAQSPRVEVVHKIPPRPKSAPRAGGGFARVTRTSPC